MARYAFPSVTRVARLDQRGFAVEPLPQTSWSTGDFVVGRVLEAHRGIENWEGRIAAVAAGDLVVGALGSRAATLQAVGDWRAIGADGQFEDLSTAGVFGKCTSISADLGPLTKLVYEGHVVVDAEKATMTRWIDDLPAQPLSTPTVLIIGTSMDAGKTTAACGIVRRLLASGLRVGGAKLTGVGRYRDILQLKDAGADTVFDFVDAGLPSTICPLDEMARALGHVFALVEEAHFDVVVVEAGASPLEPYNGAAAVEGVRDALCLTVLCASDPYAVLGVQAAFEITPDLVSGRAASTVAGIELVERLTGIRTLSMMEPASSSELDKVLAGALTDKPSLRGSASTAAAGARSA